MTALSQTSRFPVLSSGTLQRYLDSIQQIPVLTAEEETELFQRFQVNEDLDAARELVMSHLRYVAYIARGYSGYGLPLEDLIQQGNVGLMKSVKKFDLSHGVRLVSFAVHWIKAEIHEYVLKNWKIVKVATTKAQRKLFFNLRKAKERLGWFNSEEVNQVASDLGVKPEEVLEMESRLANVDESFEPVTANDDAEFNYSPSGYLSHGEAEDPSFVVSEEEQAAIIADGMVEALKSLDERSRDIVESRWLQGEKTSLKDLAEKYGVSLERIRQVEAKAFKTMQPFLQTA
ncbi:MAG: RNA polymerase sigma factor RpoH [Gammaproteobacteria bacterium]|jgi:RNA polymerase sigma-32 factor|nr:RNA polymerase sigma factor RpoH [Gammaproteobacteria bacterium]MBT5153128.1 RNA polymerase sigma factor RpoH [Gammaproteobacteria bacterium]MBT6891622.1 RNA polymerase sigma factor RpoH [Gammaproteobacteria bacterium]MBT7880699.1 RNA polymerase sigma factor RpoH [Gammaproteobacteria bacterium]